MEVIVFALISDHSQLVMTSVSRIQFERFINDAIAHRHWLTAESFRIVRTPDHPDNDRCAISGAIRELDELICQCYVEAEKSGR
jgi:hypothetical protein